MNQAEAWPFTAAVQGCYQEVEVVDCPDCIAYFGSAAKADIPKYPPVTQFFPIQMVFLAITPKGLKEAMLSRSDKSTPIWCGSDAISEEDFELLRRENVTRFIYSLSGVNSDLLDDAIDTIEQHHPDQTIWVET